MTNNQQQLITAAQIQSTLLGGFVGDALGVPVEFLSRAEVQANPVTGMRDFGTYNQPTGTWSDDTTMSLCLMANLTEQGDLTDLMMRFVDWARHGAYTPFGTCFDIGLGTTEAIQRFESGIAPEACGGRGKMDNGNGAIMRLAPLVFDLLAIAEPQVRFAKIAAYTKLTHGHPRAIVGSIIYLEILREILLGHDFPTSLQIAQATVTAELSKVYLGELSVYERIFNADFATQPESTIKSSGYVVDTLEAAVWCLSTTSDYSSSVLKAANLGSDTDTIALVTGTLAGAAYGLNAIPLKWRTTLQNPELLNRILESFCTYCLKE
ncbi:ADP-ribosylglycohydrolase family protein [Lapidilactobacillus bayanensis]|uniref:ADP-ribosylglycohydrolase family protein n=1 Tax=Lapidilactobacillus bayanensis TaxID=2485998 RepID=UPI0013DE2F67|nr:ADP-ribosylglycohydrolase family protein [Lapidilactobacillus bayanensis]